MSPSRSSYVKPETPGSVKILMLVEAGVLGFLSFWLINEYLYNYWFRLYIDSTIGTHLTTYTIILGLTIGLTGSVVAATLWKNLQEAKVHLERVTAPRLRAVKHALSALPTIDEDSKPLPNPETPAPVQEARTTSTPAAAHAAAPVQSTPTPTQQSPATPSQQEQIPSGPSPAAHEASS